VVLEASGTVLPPSDATVLQALADTERLLIVGRLLRKPATQLELRAALDMKSGTASKQLGLLEARRIIARDRSHGPYGIVAPRETAALLEAAADLAAAISRRQAVVDEEHVRQLRESRSSEQAAPLRSDSREAQP
jgi:DNA-binding HxlR family transcriptional regulator